MSKTVPDIATPSPGPIPIETQEKLLKIVMRRQATLSLSVAAFFLVPLMALPWINLSQSAFMNSRLLGFSVTWVILGICSFPLTWMISAYFVHKSDSIEAECTAICRQMLPSTTTTEAAKVASVASQEEGSK